MPSSNRSRGDYLERQTRLALEVHGWIVVRAAGSLGVADLAALRLGNTPLLISCKLDGKMSPGERRALVEACQIAGARPIMSARSIRGHVDIHLVRLDPSAPMIDQLRVPYRPGKTVAETDAELAPDNEP